MNIAAPFEAVIKRIKKETRDTFTLTLRVKDRAIRKEYGFTPGQFNMLYVPGIGEAAISICSATWREDIRHTIRVAGDVTTAISNLKGGDVIGVRGPFGRGWPMEMLKGNDLMIMAGGLGIAPFRSLLRQILREKEEGARYFLLYGAKTPKDIIYRNEFPRYGEVFEVLLTVDKADPEEYWKGDMGVVTNLLKKINIIPEKTIAFICGPEIMMQSSIKELINMGLSEDSIYISMERHMNCGMGVCGHCMFGPKFICKDGPVFSYTDIIEFLGEREI